jgi:hypothetical protein
MLLKKNSVRKGSEMAGFFQLLKESIIGKPVRPQGQIDPNLEFQSSTGIRKHEIETFPEVRIRRIVSRIRGHDMEVACEIENESDSPIVISNLRIMGRDNRMSKDVHPRNSCEIVVYSGPMLRNTGDSRAILQYRTAEGRDYFESEHDVQYAFHQNENGYSPDQIHSRGPIRDIYG